MSGRDGAVVRRGPSFSLRLKITLTFLIVSVIVSGLLSAVLYRALNDGLLRQVQTRVMDLSVLGSGMIDREALARLVSWLGPDLARAQVDAIETSSDFRLVSDELNQVRDMP